MKPTRRWGILLSLLLGSIAAAIAMSRGDGQQVGVVEVARRAPAAAPQRDAALAQNSAAHTQEPEGGDRLARLNVRRIEGDLEPLFPPMPKPRPVQAAEALPPKPAAPPLPFKYLGRMIENGKPTLFLAMGERNLAVQAGQVIDDVYRVEAIGNGEAEFIFLPLKEKQTLPIGGEGS